MDKTERRYWVNGHQIRGINRKLHTFCFSAGSYAMMVSFWGVRPGVKLYHLVDF